MRIITLFSSNKKESFEGEPNNNGYFDDDVIKRGFSHRGFPVPVHDRTSRRGLHNNTDPFVCFYFRR